MVTKRFKIYQLKHDDAGNHLRFMPLDFLNQKGWTVKLSNYNEVYNSTITSEYPQMSIILELIYQKFNCDRPDDFKGHSMSVSDIVLIDGKYYYCDSLGFKEVNP